MKVISEFIAPWALANETIPFHLVWESELPYDLIRVHIPSEFTVSDFFNVDEYVIEDSTILIKKLKTHNYFGLVVSSNEIYKEYLKRREIIVEFLSLGEVKYIHPFEARIIRPLLEVVEPPEKIVINEDTDPNKLINISVKYSGLGRARISINVGHKGEIISHTDSLYYQILKRVIGGRRFLDTFKEDVELRPKDLQINGEGLKELTEKMIKGMKEGIIPPDLEPDSLKNFGEWLKQSGSMENLMKIIYSEIEQLMIGAILYYLDRHPKENVELIDGITKTIFRSRIKEMNIKINYKDSINNDYDPIEVQIKVDDQREKADKIFEAPINIEWITERIDLGV